jgi:hypothetical protein
MNPATIPIVGNEVAIGLQVVLEFVERARQLAPLGTLRNPLVVLNLAVCFSTVKRMATWKMVSSAAYVPSWPRAHRFQRPRYPLRRYFSSREMTIKRPAVVLRFSVFCEPLCSIDVSQLLCIGGVRDRVCGRQFLPRIAPTIRRSWEVNND